MRLTTIHPARRVTVIGSHLRNKSERRLVVVLLRPVASDIGAVGHAAGVRERQEAALAGRSNTSDRRRREPTVVKYRPGRQSSGCSRHVSCGRRRVVRFIASYPKGMDSETERQSRMHPHARAPGRPGFSRRGGSDRLKSCRDRLRPIYRDTRLIDCVFNMARCNLSASLIGGGRCEGPVFLS